MQEARGIAGGIARGAIEAEGRAMFGAAPRAMAPRIFAPRVYAPRFYAPPIRVAPYAFNFYYQPQQRRCAYC
jgi:hypothetical protein